MHIAVARRNSRVLAGHAGRFRNFRPRSVDAHRMAGKRPVEFAGDSTVRDPAAVRGDLNRRIEAPDRVTDVATLGGMGFAVFAAVHRPILLFLFGFFLVSGSPAWSEGCLCDSTRPLRLAADDEDRLALVDGGLQSPIRLPDMFDGLQGRRLLHFVLPKCKVYAQASTAGRTVCRIVDTLAGTNSEPPGGCLAVADPTRAFRLGQGTWIAVWEEEARRFHLATYSPKRGYKSWFSYHYADGREIDAWPYPGSIRMNTDCDLTAADCREKFARVRTWEFTSADGLRLLHPDMLRVRTRRQ